MLLNYLNRVCDVYTTSLDESSADGLMQEVLVYQSIPCYFEILGKGENLRVSNISEDTNVDRFSVVIEFDNRDVKIQDVVELYDIDGLSQ
jgi:hypothetical protein